MENYLTQLTNYLLTQSWQIAALILVIAAVNLALRNRSAHIRYLLWLIVLAKCLVPPLLTVPVAVLPQEKPAVVTFETEVPAVAEPIVLPSAPAEVLPALLALEKTPRFTIHQWLGLGWVVGVAAFVIFAVIKALRTDFWLWRQRKRLPAELQIGIENLFSGLEFRTLPKVWLLDGIGQPFVWGLLRGSIYLPADFIKVNSAEHRRGVLGHELSHILRFDAAVNLLQIIGQAIFWFHPFVWWANKKIRAEREKCCDEMAIAHLGAKAKDYSSAIVDTLIVEHESTWPVPSLAVAGPVKNIEERIKTMLRPEKKFYRHPSLPAAAIVVLIALLAVPTTLELTARAENNAAGKRKLLITSNRTGNYEIFLMNEDGSEAKNLTNHDADDSGPAWSPDGKRIVFSSKRSGNFDIYVMDADGSNVQQLTIDSRNEGWPAWSPDGKIITFTRNMDPNKRLTGDIFTIKPDGTGEKNLTDNPAHDNDATWSPDGKRIVFSSTRGGGAYHFQLYVMGSDGKDIQRLLEERTAYTYPAWSPDGNKLVFSSYASGGQSIELFLYNFESGKNRQLTTVGGLNTYPAWSSDGKKIAFQHHISFGKPGTLHIMDADGSNLKKILTDETHVRRGGGRPAWKPK